MSQLAANAITALDAPAPPTFAEKIWRINWGLALVLTAIACIGVVALYSAAGGRFDPWAARHAVRYGSALGLMLAVALMHPRVWLVLAWPIYIASMLLLVAVDPRRRPLSATVAYAIGLFVFWALTIGRTPAFEPMMPGVGPTVAALTITIGAALIGGIAARWLAGTLEAAAG